MKVSLFCLTLVSLLLSGSVHGHYVWLEPQEGDVLLLRFGEMGKDGVRLETSPGRLDRFQVMQGWEASTDDRDSVPTRLERKSDHFEILNGDSASVYLVEDTGMSVAGKDGDERQFYYGRWVPKTATALSPALTLDVLPETDGQFSVWFRGEPLADARVSVRRIEDGSRVRLTSDPAGRIEFQPEQSGLYLMTCNFRVALPGFVGGQAYSQEVHSCTLSFQVKE